MTDLTPDVRALLDAHGFDAVPFEEHRRLLSEEGFDPDRYRVTGRVELPEDFGVRGYPEDPGRIEELAALGGSEIEAGRVGVVILNGGMATRFGEGAKGAYPVLGGRSFLDFKIRQVLTRSGGVAPIFLMNSFATDRATRDHLGEIGLSDAVETVVQNVSLRLTPTGDIFRDGQGMPSLYAPGHGDFPYVMKESGALGRMADRGVRMVTLSNVDNLGASLDPVIIGMHVDGGLPLSVELVDALEGDVGGFPAMVEGRMMILEGFRVPRGFQADKARVFNTNTFVFDIDPIFEPPELDWFSVAKKVGGETAIQFERLVGQLTEHLETGWLRVPRTGSASRFVPIKTPRDLDSGREILGAILGAQGLLP